MDSFVSENFGISGDNLDSSDNSETKFGIFNEIVEKCNSDEHKDVSFVFTHSHRLRCFLAKLMPERPDILVNSMEDPFLNERYDPNPSFKNNSVLLLRLFPGNSPGELQNVVYKLDLLVDGKDDVDNSKKQWSMVSTTRRNKKGDLSDKVFKQRTGSKQVKTKIDKIQYIFLIRHGQATHNLYKKGIRKPFQSLWNRNTKLTDDSKESLNDTGRKIGEFFNKLNIPKVDSIFVSDLSRTHETCQQFLTSFLTFDIHIPLEFYVLPCSHELQYMNDGDCDGAKGLKLTKFGQWSHGMAGENISTCDPHFYKNGPQRFTRRFARNFKSSEPCNIITINDINYQLNWEYYAKHYPGGVRGTESERDDSVKCRNNSLLNLLLDINKSIHSNKDFRLSNVDQKLWKVLPESDVPANEERLSQRSTEEWPSRGGRSRRKTRRKSIRNKRIRKTRYM